MTIILDWKSELNKKKKIRYLAYLFYRANRTPKSKLILEEYERIKYYYDHEEIHD